MMIEIIQRPIKIWQVLQSVATERAGGLAHFIGTVRHEADITGLFYECYPGMAERVLKRIVAEAMSYWPIEQVSVSHRYGWVRIGEASVVIAVSSAHRREAFAACQYVIDELKERVPIWKEGQHEKCC